MGDEDREQKAIALFERVLREGTGGEAAERLDDLMGIASHDLRSPLANIRSYAGMILAGRGAPLDPRVKRAAQVIAKNADRGLRQIDDLVDLIRAEAGLLDLEPPSLPTIEVLRLAFEEARPSAVEKEIVLTWAAPDGLLAETVDADKMRRSLRALLDEGIRRTPPGGEVRLVAESRAEELYLAVEDAGPRPSLEETTRAFDWEEQALASRRLGVGVSLALCQAVARAHGGRTGMAPRDPTGAVWYIALPR